MKSEVRELVMYVLKLLQGVFGCVYMVLYTVKGTMNINDTFFCLQIK